MDKKILITGATGFAGSHLIDYFRKSSKDKILGTYFSDNSLSILGKKDDLKLFKVDLTRKEEVTKLITDVKPDLLYHLAALTSPIDSFSDPSQTFINNIVSEINILEEIRKNNLKTKILIVSSAEVYGNVEKENLPISENVPFNPTNPYAVSKIAQDYLGRQYFLSYGLNIVRVRPFNHIGPRQSPNFVVSSFAKKIADIEKGKSKPILTVGNLEARRDFTDVRDMVNAYDLILEKGELGEVYNIGSGKSYKIGDVLDMLLSLSKSKISIEVDKKLLRPVDNPDLVCDCSKLNKATNWLPKILLKQTLEDTLDYWRSIN